MDPAYQKMEEGGWVSVFLNLKKPAVPDVVMQVTGVEIRKEGSWELLRTRPFTVASAKIGAGQIFVARNGVLPGYYDSLRLIIEKVEVLGGLAAGTLPASPTTVQMDLDRGVEMFRGGSHSLFVTWDVEKTMSDPQGIAAGLQAHSQAVPLLTEILFVACPALDTVYVVRTDKNWVISSMGISGKPTYIGVNRERNLLYVLAPEDFAIKVIDLISFTLLDSYSLELDFAPDFMVLPKDQEHAFVLDTRGKRLARVDLASGIMMDRVSLTFEPGFAAYLEGEGLLAVASENTNYVYLFAPDNLSNVGSLSVGIKPSGLVQSGNDLLVAESGADAVSAYETGGKRRVGSVNLGYAPKRLLITDNRLYVTGGDTGIVTTMFPGELTVFSELRVGGGLQELAVSEVNRKLYIGNGSREGLTVIETVAGLVAGFVDLAASPLGMTVID
jgi:DNA-binding beta-propeller fold protein YncE